MGALGRGMFLMSEVPCNARALIVALPVSLPLSRKHEQKAFPESLLIFSDRKCAKHRSR